MKSRCTGNAYLALFFHALERPEDLQQALTSYKQALSSESENANNPDLHHNIGTVRYQRRFRFENVK